MHLIQPFESEKSSEFEIEKLLSIRQKIQSRLHNPSIIQLSRLVNQNLKSLHMEYFRVL